MLFLAPWCKWGIFQNYALISDLLLFTAALTVVSIREFPVRLLHFVTEKPNYSGWKHSRETHRILELTSWNINVWCRNNWFQVRQAHFFLHCINFILNVKLSQLIFFFFWYCTIFIECSHPVCNKAVNKYLCTGFKMNKDQIFPFSAAILSCKNKIFI